MPDAIKGLKHEADLVMLDGSVAADDPVRRRAVRGQNFLVEWFHATRPGRLAFASGHEAMVILFDTAATISGEGLTSEAPQRSLSIVPAGRYEIDLPGGGRGCVLSTERQDTPPKALNAVSYETPDPRVAAIGPVWPRIRDAHAIQVFEIDKVKAPDDNPRLKMFQSATMSINWVDYDGPRDRSALSPHAHADFEQASLAVAGDFIHHLRVAWGKNANQWRDDQHRIAGSPSVLVIPPDLIHTTEGVGDGHHLLIDIFAPPRRDFIARNWVHNAGEYRDPVKP